MNGAVGGATGVPEGADGRQVARGPVDLRSSCAAHEETSIYATQSIWAGELYSALHFGTEQMTVEVADPETWFRIAAEATDAGHKMQAVLDAVPPHEESAPSAEVVELPSSEQDSP